MKNPGALSNNSNLRDMVAAAILVLAVLSAPASQTSAAASPPDATQPRQAAPPGQAASAPKDAAAEARAKRLQRLRIESCRRHPQTCVQPMPERPAASAPALDR